MVEVSVRLVDMGPCITRTRRIPGTVWVVVTPGVVDSEGDTPFFYFLRIFQTVILEIVGWDVCGDGVRGLQVW